MVKLGVNKATLVDAFFSLLNFATSDFWFSVVFYMIVCDWLTK